MNEQTEQEIFSSPEISHIPQSAEKRLIDIGMLHYEASIAGYNERYHRGETSHTIHVWWARRPHCAMRSLVYASLVKDVSPASIETMASLAMHTSPLIEQIARQQIQANYTTTPKILDMFGGGGTIPFEAKKLGADTYSIDANELSVFIQTCNLIYSNQVNLAEAKKVIHISGRKILERLKKETDWLYPLRVQTQGKVFGYLWSYKITCPKCGKTYHLIKRPWLSKKYGNNLSFYRVIEGDIEKITIQQMSQNQIYESAWEKGGGKATCPHCHTIQTNIKVSNCSDALLGIIQDGDNRGKSYILPCEDAIPTDEVIKINEDNLLKKINATLPSSRLPQWSGIVNPAIYGIETHADFLNKRQRLLLIYLINELIIEYLELSKKNVIMAKFVIGVLSSLIDQVVDWNCRLSMWIPQNEQVGRAFCGPGVAMLWDYAETDQLLEGPANLWDKLNRIEKGIASFECSHGQVIVKHAHAQELPFEDNYFDAIITDPPYYDNIYYSILADFFYAWKRILLQYIEPSLFSKDITDSTHELVASSHRQGEGINPHESYCIEIRKAFHEAARVIKDNGVFSFVYSHSSVNGWEAIIKAYRSSPFWITSVQPLSIERKGRPRAITSEAINTCMTFVARKNKQQRLPLTIEQLKEKIANISNTFGNQLMERSGWSSADAGLAVLACAVGFIANSSSVIDAKDDAAALVEISKDIKVKFTGFTLKNRDSL